MTSRYKYDAFICCGSADRPWAVALTSALATAKISAFHVDAAHAGDAWPSSLQSGIEQSQHFVLLWSRGAAESDRVREEVSRFSATRGDSVRRLIQVNLDTGQADGYPHDFSIDTLKSADPSGPARVDDTTWAKVVSEIKNAMGGDPAPRTLPQTPTFNDYAVIIDVAQPDVSERRRNLAPRMRDWLTGSDGARVPADNLVEFHGSSETATVAHVEQAFASLIDRAHAGRRLYLYFVGPGDSWESGPAGLLLDRDGSWLIPVEEFADACRRSNAFAEIVLVADLDAFPSGRKHPSVAHPSWTLPSGQAAGSAYFHVLSKLDPRSPTGPPAELNVTMRFLSGVQGAAAGSDGIVNTETLSAFLRELGPANVRTQMGGASIVFPTPSNATAVPGPSRQAPPLREGVAAHTDDASLVDQLNRRSLAEVIGARIKEARSDMPAGSEYSTFMLNLHGPWGSGKTTILKLLREYLQPDGPTDEKSWVVVEFNAWRHQRLQPPWWMLIREIYAQSRAQLGRGQGQRLRLRWFLWRIRADVIPSIASLLLIALAVLLVAGIWPLLTKSSGAQADDFWKAVDLGTKILAALIATGAAIVTFTRSLVFGSSRAAQTYLDLRSDPLRPIVNLFKSLVAAVGRPIVIFIDDLDRCDAAYVIQLLEGIQTLFREASITYVVAADRKWIGTCFENKYSEFGKAIGEAGRPLGYLFLDKAFQVSIAVPRLNAQKRDEYFRALLDAAGSSDTKALDTAQRQAEARALDAIAHVHTQEELEAKIQAAAATADPVQEQAMRAAAAKQITSAKAIEQTEHRLQPFAALLEPNPRAMKRFVNAVGIVTAAQFLEGGSVTQDALARWTLIELRWPLLAEFVAGNPGCVSDFVSGSVPSNPAPPDELRPLFSSAAVRSAIASSTPRIAALDEDSIRRIVGMDTSSAPTAPVRSELARS